MKKFCEEVLKFLESEYGDAYKFSIEHYVGLRKIDETVELTISTPPYKRIIDCAAMYYLFGWYRDGHFIEERNQYRWQKELIDMIEGS